MQLGYFFKYITGWLHEVEAEERPGRAQLPLQQAAYVAQALGHARPPRAASAGVVAATVAAQRDSRQRDARKRSAGEISIVRASSIMV